MQALVSLATNASFGFSYTNFAKLRLEVNSTEILFHNALNVYTNVKCIYIILSTDAKSVDKRNDIKRFQMSLVSKIVKSV